VILIHLMTADMPLARLLLPAWKNLDSSPCFRALGHYQPSQAASA